MLAGLAIFPTPPKFVSRLAHPLPEASKKPPILEKPAVLDKPVAKPSYEDLEKQLVEMQRQAALQDLFSRGRPMLFSPREIQVAQMIAEGLCTKHIADVITPPIKKRTVDKHRERLMRKANMFVKAVLGKEHSVQNCVQLVTVLSRIGLIELGYPQLEAFNPKKQTAN